MRRQRAEREGGGNDKMKGKGSTLTHKCLGTYIEFYLCICKSLSVAQIAVPGGSAICATNRNLRIHKQNYGHFVICIFEFI